MTTPIDPRETDALRRAFAAPDSGEAPGDRACPDAGRLWLAVRGELSAGARRALVDHVGACPTCAQAWRLAVELARELPAETPAAIPSPRTWWFAVWRPLMPALAACAVLIVGGVVAYRALIDETTGPDRPQAESGLRPVEPSQGAPSTGAPALRPALPLEKAPVRISTRHVLRFRGEEGTQGATFLRDLGNALEPYRRDDFAEAARRLDALARRYPQEAEPHVYLGVSLLFVERPEDAALALREALPLADAELSDDAEWYLAVAYERAGQADAARARLETICDGGGPHAARACEGARRLTQAQPVR